MTTNHRNYYKFYEHVLFIAVGFNKLWKCGIVMSGGTSSSTFWETTAGAFRCKTYELIFFLVSILKKKKHLLNNKITTKTKNCKILIAPLNTMSDIFYERDIRQFSRQTSELQYLRVSDSPSIKERYKWWCQTVDGYGKETSVCS